MNSRKPSIVVVGAAGHAKVVIDIIEKQDRYTIAGLIDTYKEPGSSWSGYSVLGGEQLIPDLLRGGQVEGGIVAIGDNWVRREMVLRIESLAPGFRFVSAVHPSAQIGRGACIGPGTVVMAGAVINSDTRVGRFCIVNTNAAVDHDCVMEDYACVLPGAVLGGNVRLGTGSVVALGARIIHGVTVGEHSVIGAGATVLSDIPGHVVAWGTPARVMRSRKPGERYL